MQSSFSSFVIKKKLCKYVFTFYQLNRCINIYLYDIKYTLINIFFHRWKHLQLIVWMVWQFISSVVCYLFPPPWFIMEFYSTFYDSPRFWITKLKKLSDGIGLYYSFMEIYLYYLMLHILFFIISHSDRSGTWNFLRLISGA